MTVFHVNVEAGRSESELAQIREGMRRHTAEHVASEGYQPLTAVLRSAVLFSAGEDGVWRVLSRVSQIADGPYHSQ